MKNFKQVENQFQENYTLAGGENYREMVVKMPGPIPRNLEPEKTFGHYTKETNPLYFSRFDLSTSIRNINFEYRIECNTHF